MSTVSLRPVRPGDEPFLIEVYGSTREAELAPLPWSPQEKDAFVRQQFAAQRQAYARTYRGASFDVVEVDGRPAGRLYVARWPTEIRVVDIALLPAFRGAGVGTQLLMSLLVEAAAGGKTVTIHVEQFNPALPWYQRLGFVPVAERGPYLLMEHRQLNTAS